jgi:hypothetical protein
MVDVMLKFALMIATSRKTRGPRIQCQTMLDSQLEVQQKFMKHAAGAAGALINTASLSPSKSCHVGDN